MKSYVITLTENQQSISSSKKLIESGIKHGNEFEILTHTAVVPEQVDSLMKKYRLTWNYPWMSPENDFATGLYKSPYLTANKNKRIACFLSHYQLWKQCCESNEPILVFEHDALVTKKIDLNLLSECNFDIIGINNPLGATRKSQLFHDKIVENRLENRDVVRVPKIDFDKVPQGLAGNSAYYIKPYGAKQLLDLVSKYGAWPNDAIMCRQLVRRLGVTTTFYTTVQRTESTTKL